MGYRGASVLQHRLTPGERFATDFEVLEVLGNGSMGVVYRALRISSGTEVALKLMHPVLSHDPKSVHRFEREARAGASIDSPHVVRVVDNGWDEPTQQHWLAMQLARGVDLGRLVNERGALSGARAVDLLEQLFAALVAAHRVGVVHRDLKPDNIMVEQTADGALRLAVLDFGIAKSLSSATAISTSPGQGTPLWTAPEQTRLDDVPNPTADVWALGLLSFFVLTGKLYWRYAQGNSSMVQLSMELVRSPIAPPSQRVQEIGVAATLPVGFDAWFARCVHREARERFRDAREARDGFAALISGQ